MRVSSGTTVFWWIKWHWDGLRVYKGTSVCGELTGIGTDCVCLSVLLFCGELTGIGTDCVCLPVLLFCGE